MDPCEDSITKDEESITVHYNEGYDTTYDEKIETKGQVGVNETDVDVSPEEEERILEKLREVVRKCTNADPNKRPTAAEVLKILDTVYTP